MISAGSLRLAAVRLLYRWAKHGPFETLARLILSRRGERVLNIVSLDKAGTQHVALAPPSEFTVRSPEFAGEEVKCLSGQFPEVRAYRLREALVSPYSSGCISRDDLLVSPHVAAHRGRHLIDSGGLFYFAGDVAVSYKRQFKHLDAGIHVCGSGAFNWYHFVVEMLPKIFLLLQSNDIPRDLPLLLPEEARSVRSFADALATVAGDRPMIFLQHGELVRVEDLLVVDEVSYAPYSLPANVWPVVTDYAQHDATLAAFARHLRGSLIQSDPASAPGSRRIYLIRKEGIRRDHNQAELIRIAERYGFTAVAPETLSLHEQAQLFHDAQYLVGASGAAWVGLLFCGAPIHAISWLPWEYREFCNYATLARILGHRMNFITVTPEKAVRSADDAHIGGYKVDPKAFEAMLEQLLDGREDAQAA